MDIKELEHFFEYEPILDSDPQRLVDEIVAKAKKYLPKEQIPKIQETYLFAKKAHEGQLRLSWEAYIIHPLKTTEFLMELKPDIATIQTAILHDVLEDTSVTFNEIVQIFWEEVANLCEWLVKVSKIRYQWEDRHLETIKKTFLAMAKDLRVIFVKLADRIHNMQTLQHHPNPNKRVKIAEETMKIYVPVAKRLGLYYYQLYLENWAFKVLYPEEFDKILLYLKKYFWEDEKYIEKWLNTLKKLLIKEWIAEFEIRWRVKSPYRIYEKMDKKYQTQDISSIMDLLAFRINTVSIADCYSILGIVHKHYTPLIKKIKDYIAVPKFNGYKSIHTTILGLFRFPTEIQIRTFEMDDVAEFGVAAHFAYSENNKPVLVNQKQSEWIQKLQRLVDLYKNSDEKDMFKNELNIELLNKNIFLYTPKGDIKEMPLGSTVLDFAFYVHTDIGLKFKNAIVNGNIVPINFTPENGDIVQINTFKNRYTATKHWIDFLHTPSGRVKLTRFLKTTQKIDLIKFAIDGLNKHLKEFWLPLFEAKDDKISKLDDIERKLLDVLDKKWSYSQIIRTAYPKQWSTHTIASQKQEEIRATPLLPVGITMANIIVDNDKLINYQLCPECRPHTTDKIIWKSWRDGIKIHSLTCKALKTVSFWKLLEAHREGHSINNYKVFFGLEISDENINIIDIISIFSDLHIMLSKFSIQNTTDGNKIINIEADFNNPAKVDFLFNDLKKFWDFVKVINKKIQ